MQDRKLHCNDAKAALVVGQLIAGGFSFASLAHQYCLACSQLQADCADDIAAYIYLALSGMHCFMIRHCLVRQALCTNIHSDAYACGSVSNLYHAFQLNTGLWVIYEHASGIKSLSLPMPPHTCLDVCTSILTSSHEQDM